MGPLAVPPAQPVEAEQPKIPDCASTLRGSAQILLWSARLMVARRPSRDPTYKTPSDTVPPDHPMGVKPLTQLKPNKAIARTAATKRAIKPAILYFFNFTLFST